ncbi:carbohydrate-binding family 9-like protein [Mucilaginibacter kameinonensis]|uniref:carbohydrate-binding family 9-like protein n=1 Tax=Mucilaginibacter kameinonensis TaxID=452286 RepID=UPI000EF7B910|nr:carbohydrate-binding family 9-like protein [Mucilaginibacter kameinonensis]
MKELTVPFLDSVNHVSPIAHVSFLLDNYEKNHIGLMPWPGNGYKPDVHFAIAYGLDGLFIKYYVSEKSIRAAYTQPNQPVHKDSCVEFFVSFGDDKSYYSFDFNCAGTCMLSFGADRTNRELLPEAAIRAIRHHTNFKLVNDIRKGSLGWELTLMIPLKAFCNHSFTSLNGKQCRVNFYKCGDDLPDPHFLVWNNIKSAEANFHLPEFFGKMIFEN